MNWYKCLRNSVSTIFREQQRLRDGWWWPLSVPDALLANQEESDPGGIFLCTTHVMHFSFIFLFAGKDRPFASFTTNVWFSWVLTREYKHLKGYLVTHPSCFFIMVAQLAFGELSETRLSESFTAKKYSFLRNCQTTFLSQQFSNTRSPKGLRVSVMFSESQPTPARLNKVKMWTDR